MNQIINNSLIGLNEVGGVFYDYAANVFIQSALLVILLFAIDLLLRKRVRAIFRYCVWLLVLVKLILPPMLSLPTGIGYWIWGQIPAASNRAFDSVALEQVGPSGEMAQVRPAENIARDEPAMARLQSALTPLTWQAVVFLLWLAGVLAFLAVLVQRIRFVKGLVAASCPVSDELLGLLEQCRRQIGVRRDIKLRLSEAVPSPAVCGLLRPTILMPTSLVEKLSPEGLRATLIHELAHIKRGDLWVNFVQTFLQVVYFYNPFVWFANSVIRKVCEEAVDETVLVALGGQAKDYSNTLIDIGEMVFWKADLGLRLIGVAESKKALQWRIRHMLNRPIPKSSKLGALGIIVIFTIAAVLLPMARAQKPGEHREPVASENEQKPAKTLHQAAEDGDLAKVKRLIAEGADVNASDQEHKDKVTPLCVAAGEGHAEIVKILLERGAKVDANDSHGYTPVFYAIWIEDEQTVRTLISADADVNVEPKDDVSPLYYAIWQGHAGIVRALLDAGAKAEPRDFKGWSALQFALEQGNPDIVTLVADIDDKEPALHKSALRGHLSELKERLEKGAEIDQKDGMGRTPIYYALAGGQSETAKFLLDRGASMNLKTETQRTLLHQASRAGLLDIVRLLIARNMPVDAVSRPQNTPLHEAAGAGHKEIVELLISKGASIDSRAGGNRTPLYMAATFGKADIVELLISKGADINAADRRGRTPLAMAKQRKHSEVVNILHQHGATETLHGAVTSGNIDEVKRLLSEGHDVNSRDSKGQTPLHLAAMHGQTEIMELLIAKGADIEAEDKGENTPLRGAAVRGKKEVVELLLDKGADIDNKGPLALTAGYGTTIHFDVIRLLIDRGANIEWRGSADCTPLQTVVEVGRKEVAELLVTSGAKIDAAPSKFYGTTYHQAMRGDHPDMVRWCLSKGMDIPPLHQAAYFGEADKIRSLLNKGADVNKEDITGFTTLHCAMFGKHKDIVKLLIDRGADVRSSNASNASLLFWACGLSGDLDIVKLLVENGAEVNGRGFEGMRWGSIIFGNYSSLHRAAHLGHAHIVEYFLDKGADINVTCTRGEAGLTPLHFAARSGRANVVKVLIAKGADANLRSKQGYTALDIAKQENHPEVVSILRQHGEE